MKSHPHRLSFLLALTFLGGCVPSTTPSEPSNPGSGGRPSDGSGGSYSASGGSPGATGGNPATGTGGGPTGTGGGSGGISGQGGSTTPNPGTGGAPAIDAPGPADAPASSGGNCPAKFCDDFEGHAAGAAPGGSWTTALNRGALAVDESKAYSGARSVRLTHQGAPAKMFMELRQPLLPLAGNVMYGRLMYQLTKNPTGQYSHFEIVRGGGPLPSGGRAQLNTGAENGKVAINYEPGDCTKFVAVPFPEKRWTCYQWKFDGNTNEVELWVDGMSTKEKPACWKAPTMMDAVHVGWQSYHSEQPVELWIDDVAIGTQMIPCPTAMPSKP